MQAALIYAIISGKLSQPRPYRKIVARLESRSIVSSASGDKKSKLTLTLELKS